LAGEDLLIFHYPIYLYAFDRWCRSQRPPARVGLSHGVTWDDRPGAWRSRVKRDLARYAFRRAERFVANDTFFLREMGLDIKPRQGMYTEVAPRAWFIPNAVDTERFHPCVDLEATAILVPRNLYFNRGVHLAIEAFARFAPAHPEARLLIAGAPGQVWYAERLRQLVARTGLGERIEFRGGVPYADMPELYAACRMTLIPSLCGEGTSLSALESMACGTATLSTDVAGLQDLPTEQAPPDPESFAHAMADVYARSPEIGERQLAAVREWHSLPRWEAAWRAVIESATP
jgi:glycosyltransferase involved in cell wall biosynthesis